MNKIIKQNRKFGGGDRAVRAFCNDHIARMRSVLQAAIPKIKATSGDAQDLEIKILNDELFRLYGLIEGMAAPLGGYEMFLTNALAIFKDAAAQILKLKAVDKVESV